MNESEQAQTIADKIQRHDMESIPHGMEFYYEMRPADDGEWVKWDDHKMVVDSQAQKIAELEADKSGLDIALEIEATETENLRQKIAEHAKEIERLKDCMFQHMDSDTYNHCQEYLEKMRGKNENKTANEIDDV